MLLTSPIRCAFALLLVSSVARAATPTVAVMPFKDLTGGKGSIGEAIRETVTADLKDVPGLRVIERASIDRILAEQNLQAMKSDLDPLSTVKVGKLLGATMIVAGAYQKAAASVRLTARFVDVETGEIKGTAKVDGAANELLALQDRVTVELLSSAGIAAAQVQKVAKRTRPKVKSLKTIELYGDAVVETDDHKKQALLKLALDEDPSFAYASRDLDALEKRLKTYEAASTTAKDKQVRELRERLSSETDPDKRAQMAMELYSSLLMSRRFRTLAAECRTLLAGPPPPRSSQLGALRLDELCAYYLVLSASQLKQGDRVLSDGEAFLRMYPSSVYFKAAEALMQQVIDQRRKQEEGKSKVAGELARLGTEQKWDLCRVAHVYGTNGQRVPAQRLLRACLEAGLQPRGETLRELVFQDLELGDWASARAHADDLARTDAKIFASIRVAIEQQLPADVP